MGDWLRGPLHQFSRYEQFRLHFIHFLMVLCSSFLVIFVSLMVAASFGDTTSVLPPEIGVYAFLVGMGHLPALYIAFGIRTWKYYDIRINPYISLVEFLFHNAIGGIACLVEILAQALGALVAAVFAYGTLHNVPQFLAGVGNPITYISYGWAFFLEIFAGTFMGWVYFHNWYYESVNTMPISMAYVITACTIIVYPFIGATTHNPFRWLSACVIENKCQTGAWWVFVFGPGIGCLIGYFIHTLTWRVNVKKEKFRKQKTRV